MNDNENEAVSLSEAEILASPAFGPLQEITTLLEDGFDHPEIYRALEKLAQLEASLQEMRRLLGVLRPGQQDRRVAKAFDVIGALLLVFSGEKAGGVAMLRRLQHGEKACVQVAGALFYAQRFGTEKSADLSGRFCRAPFERFETIIDGTVAPCCSLRTPLRLGHLEQGSFDEIWNSKNAQAMRQSVLDGSFRYCNKQLCPLILEDRLPMQAEVTEERLQAYIQKSQIRLDVAPEWLLLAHDPTCNLACPSCRDGVQVADDAQKRRFEVVEEKVFRPLLAGSEDTIRVDVSGQGDPWSSPHYRSLLQYIADNDFNLVICLHTNALLMTKERWEKYQGLEKYPVLVDVSIDACTPWVYEVVRRPGKWERLDQNLRFLAQLAQDEVIESLQFNATVQLDNYHQMADILSYAWEVGAQTARLCMIQNTGEHLTRDYDEKNIASESHPLHLAFLECLRDPRLKDERAQLYDLSTWRDKALAAKLPSDAVAEDEFETQLPDLLEDARARAADSELVALCAAAHARGLTSASVLMEEAKALESLGFFQQASFRVQHAHFLNPQASVPTLGAGNDNHRHLPLVAGG